MSKKVRTVSKNGKRVPASESKTIKKKPAKAAKGKHDKAPEFSRTTAGAALAMVEQYDEAEAKVEELKPRISELNGLIAKDAAELRALAKDTEIAEADRGKKFASVEKDIVRREVSLKDLVEQKAGQVEMKKASMADLRKLIRDKAAGGLLFEKPEAKPAADPSTTGASSPAPKPATSVNGNGSAPAGGEPNPRLHPDGKVISCLNVPLTEIPMSSGHRDKLIAAGFGTLADVDAQLRGRNSNVLYDVTGEDATRGTIHDLSERIKALTAPKRRKTEAVGA